VNESYPYALCQIACVRGTWAFREVSRHTTIAAALNRAAFPAAFSGGLWRVRDVRTGAWVSELDGRPAGSERPAAEATIVEVTPSE